MENDVRKRIQEILSKEKTTVNFLATSSGKNQAKLRNQIMVSTAISLDTILLVLERFPHISAEWLLRGNGDMLISQPQHETHTRDIRDDSEIVAALKETIAAQKIAIEALMDQVKVLKGDIVVPQPFIRPLHIMSNN